MQMSWEDQNSWMDYYRSRLDAEDGYFPPQHTALERAHSDPNSPEFRGRYITDPGSGSPMRRC